MRLRPAGLVPLLMLVCLGLLFPPAAVAQDRDAVVDYCLDNREQCAISILHLGQDWEAHLNPDRAQSLASSMKVAHLIAYARAVAQGAVSPDDVLTKEEWARYFTGGTAFPSSWGYLGSPDELTLDDLARTMIRFSDNSFPDHLLHILSAKRIRQTLKKDVRGFMDSPNPISATFVGWQGSGGEPGSGNRYVEDFGSIGADGYTDEVSRHFNRLRNDGFVDTIRDRHCVVLPWERRACNPPSPALTEPALRTLEERFFSRSTTRTYAELYRDLYLGERLPAAVQEVVERHLEVWLEDFPTLSPAFRRYGLKGGNLATGAGNQVLTWAHYMENSSGQGVVVVVFLNRMLETTGAPTAGDVNAFAQQLGLDSVFAASVRDALEADDERPELLPSILNVKLRRGRKIILKGRVDNTSPNRTKSKITVRVYVSEDTEVDGSDTLVKTLKLPKRRAYKGKVFRVKGVVAGAEGKLLLVVVDPGDDIEEQSEDDNVIWQRLQ